MRRVLGQMMGLVLLALIPALSSAVCHLQWHRDLPLQPGEVSPATARLWLKSAAAELLWVDSRSLSLYQKGHIPGALPFPPDEWNTRLPELFAAWTAEKTVLVYGETTSDPQPHLLAERLRQEAKIDRVYELQGGWQRWHP
jgi:rhodanese-related sulfurtransferase